MRERKYKLWSKNIKEYLSDDMFFIHPTQGLIIALPVVNEEDFVLIESIGVFDKHNKEIYEGDIVETRYGRYTVTYCLNHVGFTPFAFSSNAPDPETETEVIGNIYERK